MYFLVTISFSWKEHKVRERIEFLLHAIPLAIGWGTAIVGIPLDLYNPIGWTCWIGTYPPGCGATTFPCTRADPDSVDIYRWGFFHAELWFLYVMSLIAMIVIYWSVKTKEDAMQKYGFRGATGSSESSSSESPAKQSLSRRVAMQAFLYMFCFFITWIFPMIQFVVSKRTGALYFPLLCFTVILQPLQGFFDCCIYLRPRYLNYLNERSSSPRDVPRTRMNAFIKALSAQVESDAEGETYDPEKEMAALKCHSLCTGTGENEFGEINTVEK